jgi:hypothetical protein
MKSPIRLVKHCVQHLVNKRNVFNPDGKTLNIEKLNRFVNGTSKRPREASDSPYLREKTGARLRHTLMKDIEGGKYGPELVPVAHALINWTWRHGGDRLDLAARGWLKQLAGAKPVEREADEPVKRRALVDGREVIEKESGGARSHVLSEDDARSRRSLEKVDYRAAFVQGMKEIIFVNPDDPFDVKSETGSVGGKHEESDPIDGDIVATDDKAFAMSVEGLGPEDQPELHAAGSDAALRQWVHALDVSEHKNNPHNLFDGVDERIANRGRRPAPMLRPSKSTQPPDHTVVRMVDNQILPAKQ